MAAVRCAFGFLFLSILLAGSSAGSLDGEEGAGQSEAGGVLLSPLASKKGSPFAAALFVQDHGIDASAYAPLGRRLQEDAPFYLWVGLVDFPSDTPNTESVNASMDAMLERMNADGFNGSDTRLLYAFGHGTGSFPMQDWAVTYIAGQQKVKPYPAPLKGVILLGSYLQRKFRNTTYPTGVLTIAGDMDGVTRITRVAESFYHLILHPGNLPPINYGFPHVILTGVSHMQFASGPPSPLADELDLKPEQSDENATKEMSTLSSAFMALKLRDTLPKAPSDILGTVIKSEKVLEAAVRDTGAVLAPLVSAMEMEAYHEFHAPCYEKDAGTLCYHSSPWVERAQSVMCGLTSRDAVTKDTDILWPVNEVFPHDYLPKIYNTCEQPSGCVLNASSVTENTYDRADTADESLSPIAATEQKVKLNSRQRCYEHAGIPKPDFNTTDGGSLCAEINQVAYEFALNSSFAVNKKRFLTFGQPLKMAPDKVTAVFPVWSIEALKIDSSGDDAIVTSWASKYSTANPIPLVSGLHFCKLLSPARAMEWIYVDGLRKHNSLKKRGY